MKQSHSAVVSTVRATATSSIESDGLATRLPGVALCVETADCLPILIAEVRARAVAVVHAGWRGTRAGIARQALDGLATEFKLAPEMLRVAIGPHIQVCCYEVGEEVLDVFGGPSGVFEAREEWSRPHLNLGKANLRQLVAGGVPETQVFLSPLCTRCRGDLFYSYRREGDQAGRMLSVVGIFA